MKIPIYLFQSFGNIYITSIWKFGIREEINPMDSFIFIYRGATPLLSVFTQIGSCKTKEMYEVFLLIASTISKLAVFLRRDSTLFRNGSPFVFRRDAWYKGWRKKGERRKLRKKESDLYLSTQRPRCFRSPCLVMTLPSRFCFLSPSWLVTFKPSPFPSLVKSHRVILTFSHSALFCPKWLFFSFTIVVFPFCVMFLSAVGSFHFNVGYEKYIQKLVR